MAMQPWRKRSSSKKGELPGLPARLVYSLLKAAARIAARGNVPMGQLLDLAQMAYFEELRRRHPRELSAIAERLGLSLRTVSSLSRRLKTSFFAAESQVQPARRIAALLLDGPKTLPDLKAAVPELPAAAVKGAIALLASNHWIESEDGRYRLTSRFRSYVDETLTRRIDGLNNQMEILAASVWRRFVEGDEAAIGRSWVFAARPESIRAFLDETVRGLRHGAIDLEEAALGSQDFKRYGVTIAFADVEEPK